MKMLYAELALNSSDIIQGKYSDNIYNSIIKLIYLKHRHTYTPRSGKNQQHFVHNFEKLKCIAVIFDKQHRESNAELPTQLLSAPPNQCCYLTK